MSLVKPSELPQIALLRASRALGAFTDCYVAEVDGTVLLSVFVEAFYTTALFKVERTILKWLAGKPSTDADAKKLGEGTTDFFAAWRVESRSSEQLLLVDFTGRTKSWLMVVPVSGATGQVQTRLYFGSAVIPRKGSTSGARKMDFAFRALLGFHRLYSRLLLRSACTRVLAIRKTRVL